MARRRTPRQRKSHDRRRQKRETQKRQAKVRAARGRAPRARMRRAAASPLHDCLISEDWRESRLATLVISRDGPEGIAAGFFLVDLGCLGVKNCFAVPDYACEDYQAQLDRIGEDRQLVSCDPALARKIVEVAVDYAAGIGFRPNRDYRLAREIFGDIDAESCSETIPCGDAGKPLYVQGPDDDAEAILSQLEASVGPDGFDYVLEGGDMPAPSLPDYVRNLAVRPEWLDEDGDSAESESDQLWRRLRRCEGTLIAAILADAVERYDPALLQEAWGEFTCWDDVRFDSSQLPELFPTFVDWLTFSWRPDLDDLLLRDREEGRENRQWGAWPEKPLALEYVAAKTSDLDAFERSFLTEMTRPPYSFYSVVRVLNDCGLVLEDILTRRQIEVRERTLTQSVQPGIVLFARVFEQELPLDDAARQATSIGKQGVAIVCGCAPALIPPIYREAVMEIREQIQGVLGRVDVEALHEYDCELRASYFDIAERLPNSQPLEMALGGTGAAQREGAEAQLENLQGISDAIASFPGGREQLREHMARHWKAWLDQPVPTLRDQTPREAARTPLGRELLEALLYDYEWSSRRLPDPAFAPDVAALRRELGLE